MCCRVKYFLLLDDLQYKHFWAFCTPICKSYFWLSIFISSSCKYQSTSPLSAALQSYNAEQVALKHNLQEAALQRDVSPDTDIAFTPGIFIITLSPSHTPQQIKWYDACAKPFFPSSPVIPPRWTPTQASRQCKRTGMWPCMCYTRLICSLMGNVLLSRSWRGGRQI